MLPLLIEQSFCAIILLTSLGWCLSHKIDLQFLEQSKKIDKVVYFIVQNVISRTNLV